MKSVITQKLPVILIAIAFMWIAGCTTADPEATLLQAENDLQYGDLEGAANSCDMLCDTANTSLSPTQLCRLALIYAKISERSEKDDYMAAAAKCFDRAVGLSTDSIESYIESLNIEDQSYVRVIREVSRTLNAPIDISREFEDEEYADSVMSDGSGHSHSISSKITASL